MKVYSIYGDVIVEGEIVNLKITSDRKLYKQSKDDKQYVYTERRVPIGMSKEQKELYLIHIHQKGRQALREQAEAEEE